MKCGRNGWEAGEKNQEREGCERNQWPREFKDGEKVVSNVRGWIREVTVEARQLYLARVRFTDGLGKSIYQWHRGDRSQFEQADE